MSLYLLAHDFSTVVATEGITKIITKLAIFAREANAPAAIAGLLYNRFHFTVNL